MTKVNVKVVDRDDRWQVVIGDMAEDVVTGAELFSEMVDEACAAAKEDGADVSDDYVKGVADWYCEQVCEDRFGTRDWVEVSEMDPEEQQEMERENTNG